MSNSKKYICYEEVGKFPSDYYKIGYDPYLESNTKSNFGLITNPIITITPDHPIEENFDDENEEIYK